LDHGARRPGALHLRLLGQDFLCDATDDSRLDISLDTGLRALVMSDGHLKAWAPSPRRLAGNRQHETTANEAP